MYQLCSAQARGQQLCKIILKSMLKCTSYDPDKLKIWPFWPLFDPCDLDLQPTWKNVLNGTSPPLVLIYVCTKFNENIHDGIKVIQQTRFSLETLQRGIKSGKIPPIDSRDMVDTKLSRWRRRPGSALILICPPHLWWGDINIYFLWEGARVSESFS